MTMCVATATASAAPSGEFSNPSWTELPTPSLFNTTPSCPVSETKMTCQIPQSTWPPPDPGNLEWGERTKNADGSWDTFHSGYINSAYWPAEKRPDIETYGIERFGYEFDKPDGCSSELPRCCFLTAAEELGCPIDRTPGVGALWLSTEACVDENWNVHENLESGLPFRSECAQDDQWYLGYVEEVLPNGAFVISWGGSETAADSGLARVYMFPEMAPVSEFIHLMPPGTPRPGGSDEKAKGNPARSPDLQLFTTAVRGRLSIRIRVAAKASGKIVVRLHEGGKARLLTLHGNATTRHASLSPGPGRYLIVPKFHPNPGSGWSPQKVRRIVWIHY